ncbi:hypothetical protein [uncultured Cohaesibacter sp.]|uniref:hypothetical protein n=1 Tax=uncultured Cohaesibacter sp. TaxID=1002546 RepID=UPI0029C71F65|nr:hypothetical protein [uncultured Cohaesibacter sp.]
MIRQEIAPEIDEWTEAAVEISGRKWELKGHGNVISYQSSFLAIAGHSDFASRSGKSI